MLCFVAVFSVSADLIAITSNDVDKLQKAVANTSLKDYHRARYAVKLAFLKDVKNVDSVEKIEAILINYLDKPLPANRLAVMTLTCCKTCGLGDAISVKAFEKYKSNFYAQRQYVLEDYPSSKKYTNEEKRIAAVFCMKELIKLKDATIKNKQLSIVLEKYIKATESTDISIIKSDLLPIYRQVVMGLSESSDLKSFATKIGLVLRSCGMDIK